MNIKPDAITQAAYFARQAKLVIEKSDSQEHYYIAAMPIWFWENLQDDIRSCMVNLTPEETESECDIMIKFDTETGTHIYPDGTDKLLGKLLMQAWAAHIYFLRGESYFDDFISKMPKLIYIATALLDHHADNMGEDVIAIVKRILGNARAALNIRTTETGTSPGFLDPELLNNIILTTARHFLENE